MFFARARDGFEGIEMTRMLKTWSRGALQAMLFAGLALGFAGNAAAVPVEL